MATGNVVVGVSAGLFLQETQSLFPNVSQAELGTILWSLSWFFTVHSFNQELWFEQK